MKNPTKKEKKRKESTWGRGAGELGKGHGGGACGTGKEKKRVGSGKNVVKKMVAFFIPIDRISGKTFFRIHGSVGFSLLCGYANGF